MPSGQRLTWASCLERVTGNRTLTISLGICVIRAFICPELRGRLSGSGREILAVAEVNGANGTAHLIESGCLVTCLVT
jgi:hypothetical protein